MFDLSQDFHRARQQRNLAPIILFKLTNAYGLRLFSDRHPSLETAGLKTPRQADGAHAADGTSQAGLGSYHLLERGARVLSFGRLRETLTPFAGDLLASLKQEEAGSISLELSNSGPEGSRPFTRMEAVEGLLGAGGEICLGFPGLAAEDFLTRFKGRVDSYRLEAESITLTLKAN